MPSLIFGEISSKMKGWISKFGRKEALFSVGAPFSIPDVYDTQKNSNKKSKTRVHKRFEKKETLQVDSNSGEGVQDFRKRRLQAMKNLSERYFFKKNLCKT